MPAFERAIAIAPDSDGATAARRALVELAQAERRSGAPRRDRSRTSPRSPHATGALPDLVAWADELRRQNKVDAARATLELAIACGHTADVHQSAFLQINKPYAMRDDEPYKAALDPTDRALLADARTHAARADRGDARRGRRAAVAGSRRGARRAPAAPARAACPRRSHARRGRDVPAPDDRARHRRGDAVPARRRRPTSPSSRAATPVIVLGPRLAAEATPSPADEIRAHARARRRADAARAPRVRRPAAARRDAPARPRSCGCSARRRCARRCPRCSPTRTSSARTTSSSRPRCRSSCARGSSSCSPTLPPIALDNARYLAACQRTADRAALLARRRPDDDRRGREARAATASST